LSTVANAQRKKSPTVNSQMIYREKCGVFSSRSGSAWKRMYDLQSWHVAYVSGSNEGASDLEVHIRYKRTLL